MECSRLMELECRSLKLRYLQKQYQWKLSRMPGQLSIIRLSLHGFMGILQPCLPHPLYQSMDKSEEKYMPSLPKGMDHCKNSQVMN